MGDQVDPRLWEGKALSRPSSLGPVEAGHGETRWLSKASSLKVLGCREWKQGGGKGGPGTGFLSPTSCLCHGRAACGSPRPGSNATPRGAHTAHLWKEKRGHEPSQGWAGDRWE